MRQVARIGLIVYRTMRKQNICTELQKRLPNFTEFKKVKLWHTDYPIKAQSKQFANGYLITYHLPRIFTTFSAGGGSCTHFACLTGHYKNIYYNELNSNIYQGFKDAINGKYLTRTEWIDRETFFKNLGKGDLYNDFVFSFGYNGKEYICGKDKEALEKAIFMGTMHQDYRLFEKIKKIKVPGNVTPAGFRKLLRDYNLQSRPKRNADRINNLTALQPYKINFSNLSYEEVQIKPNSVIYCDIPYFNTSGYDFEFNYKKFYEWANRQNEIVFISEYYMPEDLFTCVATISKRCTLGFDNTAKTMEKLFIPRAQVRLFKEKVITLF